MKILFSLLAVFFVSTSSAQLRLSAIFSDHMILQRDKSVKIWGGAKPGEVVRVDIGDAKTATTANQTGRWLVTLPSFKAGGPYKLRIQSGKETKVFSDLLFGEVWICSGQSNMQFRVNQAMPSAPRSQSSSGSVSSPGSAGSAMGSTTSGVRADQLA